MNNSKAWAQAGFKQVRAIDGRSPLKEKSDSFLKQIQEKWKETRREREQGIDHVPGMTLALPHKDHTKSCVEWVPIPLLPYLVGQKKI